jgi:hypothetical protein
MRLRQRIDIDAAVGTPMPAVEGHGDRSIIQKLVEADEVSGIARQRERRHGLARLGGRFTRTVSAQMLHQSIHGRGEFRPLPSGSVGESAKLLTQRRVELACPSESLVEALFADIGSHSTAPARCLPL